MHIAQKFDFHCFIVYIGFTEEALAIRGKVNYISHHQRKTLTNILTPAHMHA